MDWLNCGMSEPTLGEIIRLWSYVRHRIADLRCSVQVLGGKQLLTATTCEGRPNAFPPALLGHRDALLPRRSITVERPFDAGADELIDVLLGHRIENKRGTLPGVF
jgi:hypothetical protein